MRVRLPFVPMTQSIEHTTRTTGGQAAGAAAAGRTCRVGVPAWVVPYHRRCSDRLGNGAVGGVWGGENVGACVCMYERGRSFVSISVRRRLEHTTAN